MFVDPYLANVTIFAGNFAPRGWMFCQGQLLSIASNDALFALIGTTYGGDGVTTFALPDLRGRAAIHAGQGPGLSNYILGQLAGTESITMIGNNLPVHNHAVSSLTGSPGASSNTSGNVPSPVNNVPAALTNIQQYDASGSAALLQTQNNLSTPISGGSQPIEVVPPYLTMNYIICTEGIFPSRN